MPHIFIVTESAFKQNNIVSDVLLYTITYKYQIFKKTTYSITAISNVQLQDIVCFDATIVFDSNV